MAISLFAAAGDTAAQGTLRQLFEDAAAAVKGTTVSQPFADDPAEAPPESEVLPPPRLEGRLPIAGSSEGDVQLSEKNGRITLVVRDASLSKVLALLAQSQHLNIVASNDIDALISITLRDVPLEEALTAILSVANYTWVYRNNIILITSLTEAANLPADVQGREIQVFELDFASARMVAEAVTGFLTPIGKVSVINSDSANNRLTRELVVVEDLPHSLARIAAYIHQMDQPPRQVLIEAHILQVTLDDTMRCGVDLHALCQIAGSDVNFFSLPSLASGGGLPTAPDLSIPSPIRPPTTVATFAGHNLQAVIEALQSTTDTKTLGSPKLLVLNEQEARLQVGETIYFTQTTTTETASQQGAGNIETGVILQITPRISRDGRVLLRVEPEVSTAGERSTPDLPPDTSTTRLATDVMLNDGQGMVIGGLIKETDSVVQSKVPYLGDVKGVGWFFRRKETTKARVEIIVALVPRIQPYDCHYAAYEQGELVKAGVPLFNSTLERTHRPWDPVLPDGKRVYRPIVPKGHHGPAGPYYNHGSQYVVPPYPLPEQQFCEPSEVGPHHAAPLPERSFLSDEIVPMSGSPIQPRREASVITDQKQRSR